MSTEPNIRASAAWVAIYAAIIAGTSFIPTIPYPTGGGILPLSISLVFLAPVILGLQAGITASLLGALIGVFVNPAAYPFGLLDAFFLGLFPALCSAAIFEGTRRRGVWLLSIVVFTLSAIFAEIVPYTYPGEAGGFQAPPQPLYALVVAGFFVPWLGVYATPLGYRYLRNWMDSPKTGLRFTASFLGVMIGMMLWSLWQISLWALVSQFAAEVTLTLWGYAALSRLLLATISALVAVSLLPALKRSGMPAPSGSFW